MSITKTKLNHFVSKLGGLVFRGNVIKRCFFAGVFSMILSICLWMFTSVFMRAFGTYYYNSTEVGLSIGAVFFTFLMFRNFKPIKGYYTIILNKVKKLIEKMQGNLIVNIIAIAIISLAGSILFTFILSRFFYFGSEILIISIFMAFFLFITMMNKRVLSYLREISRSVDNIAAGDYEVKIPEKYTDELGVLAVRINSMASELAKAKQRESLEEQRKNEFITSIAHDLRTPLTSINGYLGLISGKDGVPLDNETILKYADIAYRKSQRLDHLINEFFDFSKYNLINVVPDEKPINIGELLEQLNQEFYPQYSANDLQSRIIVGGKPIVMGDGSMLARVFDNILTNAVRYGKNGRYIDINVVARDNDVCVEISNYDSEISSYDITRVFDRFYRTESSRNSETGGTGLGLSIAKSIVEGHGGSITAACTDGKTTFKVVLVKQKNQEGEIR